MRIDLIWMAAVRSARKSLAHADVLFILAGNMVFPIHDRNHFSANIVVQSTKSSEYSPLYELINSPYKLKFQINFYRTTEIHIN